MSRLQILRRIRHGDRRAWLHLARWLAVMYGLWCLSLALLQDEFIFPGRRLPHPTLGRRDPRIEVWRREIPGGTTEAWLVPALAATPERPAPAVVWFHGNGEVISQQGAAVELYQRLGCAVLLVEYRGYGTCAGRPSQPALVADAVAFIDRLRALPTVDPLRVLYHGRSIGGAVAAAVAARRPPAALVLESSFSSLAHQARRYLVPPFLLRHPFRTIDVLPRLSCPVLLLHGRSDWIVRVSEARALHAAAPRSRLVVLAAGHNDLPRDADRELYEAELAGMVAGLGHPATEPRAATTTP